MDKLNVWISVWSLTSDELLVLPKSNGLSGFPWLSSGITPATILLLNVLPSKVCMAQILLLVQYHCHLSVIMSLLRPQCWKEQNPHSATCHVPSLPWSTLVHIRFGGELVLLLINMSFLITARYTRCFVFLSSSPLLQVMPRCFSHCLSLLSWTYTSWNLSWLWIVVCQSELTQP
jgi:hypothetical protein